MTVNFSKSKRTKIGAFALGLIAASAAFHSCGKKDASDSASGNSGTTTPDPNASNSPTLSAGGLAIAVPAELSVASPYSVETAETALASAALAESFVTTGSINVGTGKLTDEYFLQAQPGQTLPPPPPPPDAGTVNEQTKQNILSGPPKGFAQARAQRQYMLRKADGIAACIYASSAVGNIGSPSCYGPSLTYRNHPDASGSEPTTGNIGGGDLGIYDPTTGEGESCIAAKMNGVISNVSGEVDDAIGLVSMLACVARLEGTALPATGESQDLLAAASKAKAAAPNMPFTFTKATMTRAADLNGRPVYETVLTYEVAPATMPQQNPPPPGQGAQLNNPPLGQGETKIQQLTLKHSPLDDENETYIGRLTMITGKKGATSTTNCGQAQGNGSKRALSIRYNKSSDERIQYEMRQGNFMTGIADADMFDSKNNARFPGGAGATGPVCNLGGEYAIFDLNPKYGTGKVAYSWIAGQAGENGRSMIAEVGIDSTSSKKVGCGYFGFGDRFEQLDTELATLQSGSSATKLLTQFICNWSGPGHSNRPTHLKVQRQCIEQSTSGKYVPTQSAIRFSPQNTCVRASNQTFELSSDNGSTYSTAAATSELLPIVDSYGAGQSSTNAVLKADITPPPSFDSL